MYVVYRWLFPVSLTFQVSDLRMTLEFHVLDKASAVMRDQGLQTNISLLSVFHSGYIY
jgi:hypothetical protein